MQIRDLATPNFGARLTGFAVGPLGDNVMVAFFPERHNRTDGEVLYWVSP